MLFKQYIENSAYRKSYKVGVFSKKPIGILSGQHNLQGLTRILLSRHLSWMLLSRNLGRSFSRARQVMRQDGRYSSRGSRNALFIEFANSPLNRFISLHQALAFFFGFAKLSFSVNLIPIQFILY